VNPGNCPTKQCPSVLESIERKIESFEVFLSCVIWDFGLPGCSAVLLASKL
jgi:hypothetical protein